MNNDLIAIRGLLEKKSLDPNSNDASGWRIALMSRSKEMLSLFIDHGFNLDFRPHDELTALEHFAYQYYIERSDRESRAASEALIKCLRDHNCQESLYAQIALNEVDLIRHRLIENPQLVYQKCGKGIFPLRAAALFGRPDICRVLIDAGASVNDSSDLPYRPIVSSAIPHPSTLKLFLENDARINDTVEIHRSLLPIGAKSLLHCAVEARNVASMQILIDHGLDVNSVSSEGVSVLHYAIVFSEFPFRIEAPDSAVRVIRCLLENGASTRFTEKVQVEIQGIIARTGDDGKAISKLFEEYAN
ncbi:MAG: ankyrin repeat domain-containing protein [Pirellula sp.]|nr:ankyrin repeat domain-containing protein [Pirellula sp.]